MTSYYRGKSILVLGGAGFIGSTVAEELLNEGGKIAIVDGFVRHTGAAMRNIAPYASEITLHRKRIECLKGLGDIVRDNDIIIDCMAFTSHILGMDNPLLDVHANLVSHVYLLNALKGAGTKRVIYIGSRGQYGRVKADRITEDTPCSPIDIQGVNKAAAECLLKIYSRVFGFEAVSLRVTNCFGERQKVRGDDIGLVGSFIRDALAGRTIEVYGDGARKKNILYVKDLARIIAIIAQRSIGGFEAFNVAGHELAITALLDAIIKICRKGKYLIAPFPGGIERIDTGDARFSDHKLRGVIGKTRLIEVRIALGNTVRYFRETADA